jgi:hypothetical protein
VMRCYTATGVWQLVVVVHVPGCVCQMQETSCACQHNVVSRRRTGSNFLKSLEGPTIYRLPHFSHVLTVAQSL